MRNGFLITLALGVAAALVPASPALAKKDGDRLPDRWEKRHHLNLRSDDSGRDRDRDGLSNFGEYRAHTNPRKKDSDRDGRRDGREDYDRDKLRNADEIRTGYDPGDADSDDDGVKDGKERAGVITAVDVDSVTIALAAGGSITAGLGDELDVGCKSEDDEHEGDPSGKEDEDAEPDEPDEDSVEAPDVDESFGDDHDEDDLLARAATGDHAEDSCGREALKVGAVVHEAEIKLTGAGPVLISIELL